MPIKSEVLASITKNNYSQGEVKQLVTSVSSGIKTAPTYFKRGDVYYAGVGAKRRPAVIIKVVNDMVFAIPVTHEDGGYVLLEFESRFLGKGFFTTNVVSAPISYVKDNFLGVFDNAKVLSKAINVLKSLLNNVL